MSETVLETYLVQGGLLVSQLGPYVKVLKGRSSAVRLPGVIQLGKGLSSCRSSCVDKACIMSTPAVYMRKQFQFWNINENKIDTGNVFSVGFATVCL